MRLFRPSPYQRIATSALTLGVSATLLAPMLDPAGAAETAGVLRTAQDIGPLRRGPNGEIELISPETTADRPNSVTCPNAKHAAAESKNVSGLEPGHWLEIPNSHLMNVAYRGTMASAIHGNTGPAAIMSAWGGAAFATASDALLVWGGGHTDYYGNEIYAFNLPTLTWSGLNEPSDPTNYNFSVGPGVMPDGAPPSMHAYDMLAYIPDTNQLLVAGDSGMGPISNRFDPTFAYGISTGKWQQTASNSGLTSPDNIAVYNPSDHNVYAINRSVGLQRYSPTSNVWTALGIRGVTDYHMTGAIDPGANILAAIGGGFLNVVDLNAGAMGSPTASGDLAAQKGNAPGFVWDRAIGQFVAWNGGSTVYALDPRTWQWTTYKAAADNTVLPTAPAANGTFGRFQYDERDKVFVLVNDTQQNVYLYRDCFDRHGD